MTSNYQVWKKHGKIWENIEKDGVLPVPVRRNWGISENRNATRSQSDKRSRRTPHQECMSGCQFQQVTGIRGTLFLKRSLNSVHTVRTSLVHYARNTGAEKPLSPTWISVTSLILQRTSIVHQITWQATINNKKRPSSQRHWSTPWR